MSTLTLAVRYFQDFTPNGVPCREENFIRREIEFSLPVAETALVLVDVWNTHFIESWLERAEFLTLNAVVPVLEAARRLGLTIVHAPCPEVAAQYPQARRHQPPEPQPKSDWPPPEFHRREGKYAAYRGPRNQPPGIPPIDNLGMSRHVQVRDNEEVIATGQQLHDLLKAGRILHLLYAGFATNWCIMNRDYGIRAMSRRGYNIILLRDATMGVEFPDTVDTCFATEISIRDAEVQIGFTASNEDFFAASGKLCSDLEGTA